MSRDGYEHWAEDPQAPDSAGYDPREGRRPRRAAPEDEPWPPDSEPPGRSPRQGSHRRSGEHPGLGDASPGYSDAGYADSGYPGGGQAGGGYGDDGYGGARYGGGSYGSGSYSGGSYSGAGYGEPPNQDAGYGEAGYPGSGQSGPAQARPGQSGAGQASAYREPDNYGHEAGYPDGRHSGPGYFDAGSSGAGRSPSEQPGSRSRGYGSSGQYGTGPEYGTGPQYGPGGEYSTGGDYSTDQYRTGSQPGAGALNGHRGSAYRADGYRDASYGPGGPTRPGGQDPFAAKAPFPAQDDPYGPPDPYGPADPYLPGSAGHTDPRGQSAPRGPDGYDPETPSRGRRARDSYGPPDSYGGPGYGEQDSYGGPAGYETGERYAGRDGRGQRGASQPGYDAQPGYDQPAAAQYGGGYDDHDRGAAARGGDRDDRYDWPGSVDDSGITRRREREPEDELDPDSARHNGFFRGFGAAEDEFGHRPKRRRRSRAGLVALVVLVLFLGGLVGGGAYAYHWYSSRHADWTGSQGYGTVLVQVPAGAIACGSLENTLVTKGVVASASAFCTVAKASDQSSLLQPGTFRLHKHMGAALAWKLLISPKARVQTTVAIPDGMRASKVIALLAAKTGIPLSQFQSALSNTSALGLPSWANGNPEGFLWPATYDFQPGTSPLAMLQTMVKQFNTEIAGLNLAAKAKAAQFTEYQVIIQASLLEAEVPPQYYGQVARVIDNRLNQSPPWDLGLDSTVAYVVNKYIYNLTQSDLNVNSPYNTTKHAGLPPGPIDSPDVAAIQAVLHPTQGDWLYFVTVNKQGQTLFTSSSSQFTIWANEATKNGV
jgi:UPF0755 protein